MTAPWHFAPKPGQTQWWAGDGTRFPLLGANADRRLFFRDDALSPAQCQTLIRCFENNRAAHAARTGSAYWDGRYIWQNSLPAEEVEALRLMQQLRFLAHVSIANFFGVTRPLYSDTAQLVRWDEGQELTPHADNIEPDGRPNGTPHRSFSSLVYLNDDYSGGHTFFPGLGLGIVPKPGRLVAFGSGCDYVHGVTKITQGVRHTYAGWFTYDEKMQDPNATRIF